MRVTDAKVRLRPDRRGGPALGGVAGPPEPDRLERLEAGACGQGEGGKRPDPRGARRSESPRAAVPASGRTRRAAVECAGRPVRRHGDPPDPRDRRPSGAPARGQGRSREGRARPAGDRAGAACRRPGELGAGSRRYGSGPRRGRVRGTDGSGAGGGRLRPCFPAGQSEHPGRNRQLPRLGEGHGGEHTEPLRRRRAGFTGRPGQVRGWSEGAGFGAGVRRRHRALRRRSPARVRPPSWYSGGIDGVGEGGGDRSGRCPGPDGGSERWGPQPAGSGRGVGGRHGAAYARSSVHPCGVAQRDAAGDRAVGPGRRAG